MNITKSLRLARQFRYLAVVLTIAAAMLACAMPGAKSPSAPAAAPAATAVAGSAAKAPAAPSADAGMEQTSVALAVQATMLAEKEAAFATQAAQPAPTEPPAPTAAPPTLEPTQPPAPAETATTAPAASSAATSDDMDAKVKSAKILVYEDTQPIGYWIKQSLNSAGYKYTHVGDAVGHFMENLNSGIAWDLIIIGAESKSGVRGEFWDAISEQANRKVAIVAEVWYLDTTVNGRIRPFLTACGLDFQRDQPLADSLYWLDPTNPVFNQPNTVMPLLHYKRYWGAQSGDLIKLLPGSKATLLAGIQKSRSEDYGQIASCMDGRVIFQTFSNHDYPSSNIQLLWQNYVDYTLRNHFQALGK
jgi:hypothetical protein